MIKIDIELSIPEKEARLMIHYVNGQLPEHSSQYVTAKTYLTRYEEILVKTLKTRIHNLGQTSRYRER